MPSNHITLCTCNRWPKPSAGIRVIIEALQLIGSDVSTRAWQSVGPCGDSSFILPLAAWDYADAPCDFRDWLDCCERAGMHFANAPSLMKWNMDKRYLCDLAERGVPVPDTVTVFSTQQVQDTLLKRGWDCAVLKPAIGQSGNGVRLVHSGDRLEKFLEPQILQPWLSQIRKGELSMVFLNGDYSHAVLRRPPDGEWRANSQYGVQLTPAVPPDIAIKIALACLASLPDRPLYARIDGLMVEECFLLTELELIEPALFLDIVPEAAGRFADAVRTRLRSEA